MQIIDKDFEIYNQELLFKLYTQIGNSWNNYSQYFLTYKRVKWLQKKFYQTLQEFKDWYLGLKYQKLKIDGLEDKLT
jgi:hypothetical protein